MLRIGCNVRDPVFDIHMPVDASGKASIRLGSAGVDQHTDLARCVFLVVAVVVEDFELRSVELPWPVTLLTGLLGRAQIRDWRRYRLRVLVKNCGINLIGTGNLGAHIPSSAGADVTLNALNSGMGRLQVGGVLRLHDGVTGLPAELHRVCELVGTVATHGAYQHEHESEANKESKCAALRWDVESQS